MLFQSWLRTLRTVLTLRKAGCRRGRAPGRQPAARVRPCLEALEDRLTPSTITPNPGDPQGNGIMLQDALAAANANPGADTIVLLAGYYQLGGYGASIGDGVIRDDLTITGAGANATVIDGSRIERVFELFGHTVNISGVTIQGGNAYSVGNTLNGGAGLLNHGGTVTLSSCVLSGNHAGAASSQGGAIWNDGNLTLDNSILSGNSASSGGGIYNNGGTVSISHNTTLSSNSADYGGAIATIGGSLALHNCTLSGNTGYVDGGGMYIDPAVVTIISCTFSGNSAPLGADLYNLDSSVTLVDSSVAGVYNNDGASVSSIDDLLTQVAGLELNSGQRNALTSTLQVAQQSLTRTNNTAAVNQLSAFLHQVNALVNSHRLDETTANDLISEVDDLIDVIG